MNIATLLFGCAVLAFCLIPASESVACTSLDPDEPSGCTDCTDPDNETEDDCTTTTTTETTSTTSTTASSSSGSSSSSSSTKGTRKRIRIKNLRYTNVRRIRVNRNVNVVTPRRNNNNRRGTTVTVG